MTDETADDIAGLELEAAVETVADGEDRERVRAALGAVTDEDGIVTRAGVRDALGYLGNVVSTPENRLELAEGALEDARETVASVTDIETVRTRVEGYERELSSIEAGVTELAADYRELATDPEDEPIPALALGVRELTERANGLQEAADRLSADIEAFEAWATDHDRRLDAILEDLETLGASLDELATAVAVVEGDGDRAGLSAPLPDDPVEARLDAALRARVLELLLADVRAELGDLRAWADREGIDDDGRLAGVAARLDGMEERRGTLATRLAIDAPTTVTERVDAFEATLDGLEPPIPWERVQAALAEHRPGEHEA